MNKHTRLVRDTVTNEVLLDLLQLILITSDVNSTMSGVWYWLNEMEAPKDHM